MILKRWAFNLGAALAGFWVGLAVIYYLQRSGPVSSVLVLLITTFSVALAFVFAYAAGLRLFPSQDEELIRPEMPRNPWAWLRLRGEGLKSGFPLNKSHMVIGRDVSCDVMVNHESVSRRHAEIVRLAEGYLFRDLGAKNGCFVNGQRIQEYLLQEDDVIAVGDVQLNFEAPRRPQQTLETPEHLSVADLLSPEALPLDGAEGSAPLPNEEEGTEVWRRPS